MKKFLLSTALFFSVNTYAQVITLDEAEAYSNKLVTNGFLTLKGKTTLLKEIQHNQIGADHSSTVQSPVQSSNEMSRQSILEFCAAALSAELRNRLNEKGAAIERKIFPKEQLVDSSDMIFNAMSGFHGKKEYNGSISDQTSVWGYTRMKTLHTFLKSGLIDEKIFDECSSALQSKKIRDEVALLSYMVDRSAYYHNYDFNKSNAG